MVPQKEDFGLRVMGVSPYIKNYRCTEEGIYIRKKDAVIINGKPFCPNIHKWRALRTRPRARKD